MSDRIILKQLPEKAVRIWRDDQSFDPMMRPVYDYYANRPDSYPRYTPCIVMTEEDFIELIKEQK